MASVAEAPTRVIREYAEDDAEAVSLMWRESVSGWPGGGPGGGELSTPARVAQDQREIDTLATFLAFEGEKAIGYLSLFAQPVDPAAAYVGILNAHPAWHGKGVGRDLLLAALKRTMERGFTRLDLHTWAGNMKAVPLYKKTGFCWVPDTTVLMENYLPLILRLPAAQAFFREAGADSYRDFDRDLTVAPDEEKRGALDVYTYRWRKGDRRLEAVIDRHSKGLIALETDDYAVSTAIDDRRLPVGGRRTVTWRVENKGSRPLQATVLAEGEDAVRCAFQGAGGVERAQEWTAEATAAQPEGPAPFGRPANRVRSTVVIDGAPIQLALGTEVVQPVELHVSGPRWLPLGHTAKFWLTAENALEEDVAGEVRLGRTPGLEVEPDRLSFELAPRRRASWQVTVRAKAAGAHALRAQATANGLATKVFDTPIHAGEPGAVAVRQDDEAVTLAADHVELRAPLRPTYWRNVIQLRERKTGKMLMMQDCGIGPPFFPSPLTTVAWRPRVERDPGGVTLTLASQPAALPGLTFERIVRLSSSGVVRATFRATNAGDAERTLTVSADMLAELDNVSNPRFAAPLATGLVVDERTTTFPDWRESELTTPERYGERWLALFGDGWVAATIWPEATREVAAQWAVPDLKIELGTVPPGGSAETVPIYLYAGPGDWRTARALWRQLQAPDAPAKDPEPRTAHRLVLSRFAGVGDEMDVEVTAESERNRPINGRVELAVDDAARAAGPATREGVPSDARGASSAASGPLAAGTVRAADATTRDGGAVRTAANAEQLADVSHGAGAARTSDRVEGTGDDRAGGGLVRHLEGLRVGAPRTLDFSVRLPPRASAMPAELVLDYERSTERRAVALVRAGESGTRVTVEQDGERVRVDNGRMRLVLWPSQAGRLVELTFDGGPNQLLSSPDGPGAFVWFNPWYGGIQPTVYGPDHDQPPGKIVKESFTWREVERTGAQGVPWRGVAVSTEAQGRELAGLKVELAYLTTGASNLLALAARVENASGARFEGELQLGGFFQPGGDAKSTILHYQRRGERLQKRVHGSLWGESGHWAAVSARDGSPTIALVAASADGRVEVGDMGLEGAHPQALFPLDLAPGEAREALAYVVIASDLAQARLYRVLSETGQLV